MSSYTLFELGKILILTSYIYKLAKNFQCLINEIIKNIKNVTNLIFLLNILLKISNDIIYLYYVFYLVFHLVSNKYLLLNYYYIYL